MKSQHVNLKTFVSFEYIYLHFNYFLLSNLTAGYELRWYLWSLFTLRTFEQLWSTWF